jgi:hypothetical protein
VFLFLGMIDTLAGVDLMIQDLKIPVHGQILAVTLVTPMIGDVTIIFVDLKIIEPVQIQEGHGGKMIIVEMREPLPAKIHAQRFLLLSAETEHAGRKKIALARRIAGPVPVEIITARQAKIAKTAQGIVALVSAAINFVKQLKIARAVLLTAAAVRMFAVMECAGDWKFVILV